MIRRLLPLCLVLGSLLAAEPAPAEQPNVILILADDLGYGDLGCYGQARVQTPHLDRLAAEGLRFTQFYAGSTVCAPSRCVLMTGLHTGHAWIRGNGAVPLRPEDVTLAEVLKGAGYATALIGKWGLGDADTTGIPTRQGFGYFYGYLNQVHAHNYYPAFLWRNEEQVALRNEVPGTNRFGQGWATRKMDYAPDLFAAEALQWIGQHAGQPFFLYLASTIPHANNEATRQSGHGQEVPDLGAYADRNWPEPEKARAAMVTRLDADVGRLLARLKQLGLDRKTLVLFASDNGPHREGGNDPSFFSSSGRLRGIKRDLYEGGIRSPLIARWPGRIAAGGVSDQVCYAPDLLPTLAELAGVAAPPHDGLSLVPTLLGRGAQPRHASLYWEFHEFGLQQALRRDHWKAVRLGPDRPLELYDLEADPGEAVNVAAEHPEVVARLAQALQQARTESPHWPAKPAAVAAPAPTSLPARPNIVYILSDDIGYGDLGCYSATQVRTPHLDRLAREGLRATDAHATASVCTPSRYALLTGRYAWRQPGTGIAPGDAPLLIAPGTVTVPSLLRQAGYATGLVGKWHLGLGEQRADFNGEIRPGPLELGFDYAFFIPATGDRVPCVFVENHRVVGHDPADPIRVSYEGRIGDEPSGRDPGVALKIKADDQHSDSVVNGISRIGYMTGGRAARWVDEDIADTLAARAVSFIEAQRAGPFFLYLATHDIHEPMVPHPRFRGTSGCGWRGDAIHQLDWTVGEVLAALDRLNLASNTLVVFTSDNGGALKQTYDDGTNELHGRQPPNGALAGRKGSLYEGGHRVPFLVRWPGRIAAGRVSGQLMAQVDLLATCAALTGQPLPPEAGPDSFNLLPLWLGTPADAPARDHLVLQNNGASPLALRAGDWVLLEKGGTRGGRSQERSPTDELYHLGADLAQTNNLAAVEPARVQALLARLDQLRAAGRSRP